MPFFHMSYSCSRSYDQKIEALIAFIKKDDLAGAAIDLEANLKVLRDTPVAEACSRCSRKREREVEIGNITWF